MRAYLPAYQMKALPSLSETLEVMAREPGIWQPFAGGTDLMVLLEAGKLTHKNYLCLLHLPELRSIEETPEYICLGALTTYSQILRNPTLQREFPLLCKAASETGGVATQNRGTLGGNIANASPAADLPPALLVYDAELELISAAGSRQVPYHRFHSGYKKMDLRPEELIRAIRISRKMKDWKQYYRKVGTRKAQAISKVCLAGAANVDGGLIRDIRIAVGSVAPTVVRCFQTENLLRNNGLSANAIHAARETIAREIAPIDDMRSTARYRLRVAQNLLAEFLGTLQSQ